MLIAFHYPPCQESSGHLRTLSFSRHLPEFGWQPIMLTAATRAYPRVRFDQCDQIPASMPIERAFALDARKHLSIRRVYPGWLAIPDRWSSWWAGAVPTGLALIRRYRPDVIWATQPILTAFAIAHTLNRLTGIPWVADFRDPVGYDVDGSWVSTRVRRWIERKAVASCARAVFTAPGAARLYADRYPRVPAERWAVVRNGYDEAVFKHLEPVAPRAGRPLRLVHSGLLYPDNRDPRPLFRAIADLKTAGRLTAEDLQVVLRASGFEDYYRDLIGQMRIDDIVKLKPSIPYADALRELCEADGLLVFQGAGYNGQIPTKIYEYLRVKRPILALVDPAGDTARVLREAGIRPILPMDRSETIAAGLPKFINDVRAGAAAVAPDDVIASHERGMRSRQLADLFNEVAAVDTQTVAGKAP